MHRPHAFLLTGALLWLASAAVAHAQGGRKRPSASSHIILPWDVGDREAFEGQLADRLRRARDLSTTQGLLEKVLKDPKAFGLDNKTLLKMAADLARQQGKKGFDPNDPKWRELMQRVGPKIEQNKDITREQIEAFKRIAGDMKLPPSDPDVKNDKADGSDKPPMPPDGTDKPPMPPGGSDKPPGPPDTAGPAPAVPPAPPSPSQRPEPRQAKSGSWLSRQLGKLRDSGGFSGKARRLFGGLFGGRGGMSRYTSGLSREASQLRSRLLPDMGGLKPGGMLRGFGKALPSNLRLPSRGDLTPSARLPSLSASAEGVGGGLAILAIVCGLGFLGWLLWTGRFDARRWGQGGEKPWKLGPWPLPPAAVQTRADVVKAFEYLAMLLLGRKAVPANHLEIADQLAAASGDSGQRRLAAAELATLYEHARYAPPDESLSADEVTSARRDLSLLAGVSAA